CVVAHAGEGAVDGADDVGEGDRRGGAGEAVPAVHAAPAGDEPGAPQVDEEVLEVFRRDGLSLRDRVGADRPIRPGDGELEQPANRVIRPRGDPHAASVRSGARVRRSGPPGPAWAGGCGCAGGARRRRGAKTSTP